MKALFIGPTGRVCRPWKRSCPRRGDGSLQNPVVVERIARGPVEPAPPNGACYHGAEGEGLCARRPMDEEGDETAPPALRSRTAASCPDSSSVCGAATRWGPTGESGYGRYDVMLVPRDPGADPGVVIELVAAGVPRKTCAVTASLSRGSACSLGCERRRGSGWACPGRRTSGAGRGAIGPERCPPWPEGPDVVPAAGLPGRFWPITPDVVPAAGRRGAPRGVRRREAQADFP